MYKNASFGGRSHFLQTRPSFQDCSVLKWELFVDRRIPLSELMCLRLSMDGGVSPLDGHEGDAFSSTRRNGHYV